MVRYVLAALLWMIPAGGTWAETWSAPQALEAVQNGELVLLDIRTPAEWEQSGVPVGAWPMNMYDPGFGATLQKIFARNKGKRIGMICAVGGRSGYVEKVLKKNGFPEIVNVAEGMHGSAHGPGWLKRNLPVVFYGDAIMAIPRDYTAK